MSAVVEQGYYEQTTNEKVEFFEPIQLKPWEGHLTLEALIVKKLLENNFAVYDGFVDPSEADALRAEVKSYYDGGRMRDGEIGTSPGEDPKKGGVRPEMRTDKVVWLEGSEPFVGKFMKRHILRADILAQKINILLEAVKPEESWEGCGRSKIMATVYPENGGRYVAHYDNPDRNGRKITVILYLNQNWKPGDGGTLRMKTKGKSYDVAPLHNRLLVFWSDRRCPHEVLPTAKAKDRFAVTIWYMDRNERQRSLAAPAAASESGAAAQSVPKDEAEKESSHSKNVGETNDKSSPLELD